MELDFIKSNKQNEIDAFVKGCTEKFSKIEVNGNQFYKILSLEGFERKSEKAGVFNNMEVEYSNPQWSGETFIAYEK